MPRSSDIIRPPLFFDAVLNLRHHGIGVAISINISGFDRDSAEQMNALLHFVLHFDFCQVSIPAIRKGADERTQPLRNVVDVDLVPSRVLEHLRCNRLARILARQIKAGIDQGWPVGIQTWVLVEFL